MKTTPCTRAFRQTIGTLLTLAACLYDFSAALVRCVLLGQGKQLLREMEEKT